MRSSLIILILLLSAVAHAEPTWHSADNPLWHDDDRTNDPNTCHNRPGECTELYHWQLGWLEARCMAFSHEHGCAAILFTMRKRQMKDDSSKPTNYNRMQPTQIPSPTVTPEPVICNAPGYDLCISAGDGSDEWAHACKVAYCGC